MAEPMMNGRNGRYDICLSCALKHGRVKSGGIGMWYGECDICGKTKGLCNAWHDCGLSDETVEAILEEEGRGA